MNTIQSMAQQTLKQLKEDIYLKACCLEACKDGFSVKEYQRTKAIKAIEVEKSGKKKMEIKDDVMDGNPLYAALSAWRLQKAQDAEVPAFTIAHNKTLKAIAQAKPVTMLALKAVPDMGAKSVKRFGDEILEIVLQFMG